MRKKLRSIAAWLLAPCGCMDRLAGLPYSRFAYAVMLLGSLAFAALLAVENSDAEVTIATKVWLLGAGLVCYAPIAYEAYKMPPEA